MSKRILVPLDGSVETEAILSEVKRIASAPDDVHFLHLVPPLHEPVGLEPTHRIALHESALKSLQEVRGRWLPGHRGLDLVRSGDPVEGILGAALELNISMIAMTTHGRGAIGRMFLGSVASDVVRKAQLPVLLARPDQPRTSRPVQRILVSLDGGETPKDLLETVKSVAAGSNAEIILFYANPPVIDPSPQWAPTSRLSTRSGALERLQALADALEEEGCVAWPLVSVGGAVEEILEQARKLDVDLIALSTHARSGVDQFLEGSVAGTVLRKSPVAILLQKPLAVHKPALVGESHE